MSELVGSVVFDWLGDPSEDIELEIGSSFGEFLCSIARALPERKFIGVDINYLRCLRASQRASDYGLRNICFVHGRGERFMELASHAESISNIHVYFPSPFRYRPEERLFSAAFVASAYRSLRPGASWRILTDEHWYFVEIGKLLMPYGFWLAPWVPLPLSLAEGFLAGTPWEEQTRPEKEIYHYHLVK